MNNIEWTDFNVNDYVKVKLTEKGKYIYDHRYDETNIELLKREIMPIASIKLEYDEEGYTEFQLWHLMEIYGKYLFNGCDIPFETTIKFKKG